MIKIPKVKNNTEDFYYQKNKDLLQSNSNYGREILMNKDRHTNGRTEYPENDPHLYNLIYDKADTAVQCGKMAFLIDGPGST